MQVFIDLLCVNATASLRSKSIFYVVYGYVQGYCNFEVVGQRTLKKILVCSDDSDLSGESTSNLVPFFVIF